MKARRVFLPTFLVAAIFITAAALGIALAVFTTQKLLPNPSVLVAFETLRQDILRAQATLPEKLPFTQAVQDHPPQIRQSNKFDENWSAGPNPAPLRAPPGLTLAMEWPQHVDHQAVLRISQAIAQPSLQTTAVAFRPVETPYFRRDYPLVMPPPQMRDQAVSTTPPPALPRPKPRITTATAPPTPTRAPDQEKRGPGQVAVLRIMHDQGPPQAVLELADGQVVTAGTGSDLGAFKVARIQGNRVWVRIGRREKSLTVGQVFSVR